MKAFNNARILSKGKSFDFSEWSPVVNYTNDCFKQDFVTYKNVLLACKKSHVSSEKTIPKLIYDNIHDKNIVTGVDSEYWYFVSSPQSGIVYKPTYENGMFFWEITNNIVDLEPFELRTKLYWINLD